MLWPLYLGMNRKTTPWGWQSGERDRGWDTEGPVESSHPPRTAYIWTLCVGEENKLLVIADVFRLSFIYFIMSTCVWPRQYSLMKNVS